EDRPPVFRLLRDVLGVWLALVENPGDATSLGFPKSTSYPAQFGCGQKTLAFMFSVFLYAGGGIVTLRDESPPLGETISATDGSEHPVGRNGSALHLPVKIGDGSARQTICFGRAKFRHDVSAEQIPVSTRARRLQFRFCMIGDECFDQLLDRHALAF